MTVEWEHLITAHKVRELHTEGMRRYGSGLAGDEVRAGCVDGCLGSAWTAELYQEDPPGRVKGLTFAGYLLCYLARNHCFVDGNKRVAWLSTVWILSNLGVALEATDDEAVGFVESVILGEVESGHDAVRWLGARLVPFPTG